VIRRKELPAHLLARFEAFEEVLDQIEPAKAGLVDVLPGTRLPGRPLNDAIGEYVERLERARAAMPAWRCPEVESEWLACDEGIVLALDLGRRLLAIDDDPAGFEGLLGTVEQLLDPLDPFVAAAERFRALRTRARS
jgi:hypothetical protein